MRCRPKICEPYRNKTIAIYPRLLAATLYRYYNDNYYCRTYIYYDVPATYCTNIASSLVFYIVPRRSAAPRCFGFVMILFRRSDTRNTPRRAGWIIGRRNGSIHIENRVVVARAVAADFLMILL